MLVQCLLPRSLHLGLGSECHWPCPAGKPELAGWETVLQTVLMTGLGLPAVLWSVAVAAGGKTFRKPPW